MNDNRRILYTGLARKHGRELQLIQFAWEMLKETPEKVICISCHSMESAERYAKGLRNSKPPTIEVEIATGKSLNNHITSYYVEISKIEADTSMEIEDYE